MNIKKEITFVYMDSVEKQIYDPISKEAEKRGYSVKFTKNKLEKCEIGFYCQHINFPQYSKFSVIMLHDIIQQYGNWPDVWLREPWNKYDIGILPGKVWEDNWNQCSQYYYARPRKGMYRIGWPKADVLGNVDREESRRKLAQKYHLDLNKRTILYAPSWECDNKQDEFVQSMLSLDVNIVIKQYAVDPKLFPNTHQQIQKMYELHKDDPRVTILDPKLNILYAIAAADVLVSDESSTMCEAVMMGIPAVSVSDWMIPDVTPSRYPSVEYDFVLKTVKSRLSECIKDILENYEKYAADARNYSSINYSNIGCSSSLIMDIVDACVSGRKIPVKALEAKENKKLSFKREIYFRLQCIKREILYNYCEKYSVLKKTLKLYRKIKKKLLKKSVSSNI